MKTFIKWFSRGTEFVAAMMMAAMFATFILQVFVRYSARTPAIAEALPFLDPGNFGWTLEFCLAIWVWMIFWGNSFVVRDQDHVTFDIIFLRVRPEIRKWLAIISALAITVGLLLSLEPTWGKFYILRLKSTATLSQLFGSGTKMRDIYSIYALFLIAVSLRYAWRAVQAYRKGVEDEGHHHLKVTDE